LMPGRYVVVDVSDTGTGMSPETMQRVFEPFFTTKSVGRGTGLGLSMVHGFALQAGGAATIRSAPGAGSTVSLYLPCAAAAGTRPAVFVLGDEERARLPDAPGSPNEIAGPP
jgi:signal transduction histidine kinase